MFAATPTLISNAISHIGWIISNSIFHRGKNKYVEYFDLVQINVLIKKFLSNRKRTCYTGCIKKKVIELQRAITRELLGV
jgi:hypothetical protein